MEWWVLWERLSCFGTNPNGVDTDLGPGLEYRG